MYELNAESPTLPTSRQGWQTLLDRLGVRPSKGLGQNFLFERGIVQRMVGALEVEQGDLVLEIGPGLGILTEELLHHAGEVVAVELDRRLAEHLRATFGSAPGFRLVEGDALTIEVEEVVGAGRPYLVAANLPYSVGTAVLRRLLETPHRPRRLALMMQREVAERLVARPPKMTVVGIATQFYAEARIAFAVPASVFVPPPKVESAVVLLETRPELPLPKDEHERFFRIVNSGFRHKRKQLANSIADELGAPKAAITEWLTAAGIDPMRRAETVDVAEWVAITRAAPPSLVP
ncbi:MAG: rRNA (adenine1518-N6/adenine1519-N6)-dimethyltransferase [Thermomicrobiales bacterium]|jgi:16S rRNA (adenine1518-N6/adenine1519-N6)-dimethyltransferase|nr:rRNA (adenine1518-N6/adenine1519-N6)-dimethyltransferase [Thermomicrobiales bacterium]